MKTMRCKQLGGACEKRFRATSFDEISAMSRQHAMEMIQKKDAAHLLAMGKMQELMQDPDAMKRWMEDRRREFDALPDD